MAVGSTFPDVGSITVVELDEDSAAIGVADAVVGMASDDDTDDEARAAAAARRSRPPDDGAGVVKVGKTPIWAHMCDRTR